jgi:hypothetical protein
VRSCEGGRDGRSHRLPLRIRPQRSQGNVIVTR